MPLTTTAPRLHYTVAGSGPPLCLVAGYRQSSDAWPEAFLAALAVRHTLITLDNRGTGRSDKPASGYDMKLLGGDVLRVLDEVGIARTHLLGFSMGGAIAQEVVAAAPERVERLILFATFCGGLYAAMAPWPVYRLLLVTEGMSAEQVARRILPVTYTPEYLRAHPAAVERQLQRELRFPTPGYVCRQQLAALRSFDRYHALSAIRAPTLVATGDADALVVPRNSALMAARIPHARLEMLADLGHRAIWEAPEEMAGMIGDFLAAAMPAAASAAPATPGLSAANGRLRHAAGR